MSTSASASSKCYEASTSISAAGRPSPCWARVARARARLSDASTIWSRSKTASIQVGETRITAKGLLVGDRVLGNRETARFRTNVGMVFQAFNLFPHLTALGNIIEAPVQVLGWPKQKAIEKAMALLDKVNLQDKGQADPPFRRAGSNSGLRSCVRW